MKVLHTECGLNWGGQEYRTVLESNWLNQNGHQSWIACDPRSELYKRRDALGAKLVPVSMRNNADLIGIRGIRRICRQHDVDLIHTHGPKDSWMCFPFHLAGIPVVRSRHVTVAIRPGFRHTFIYKHGCRKVIATAEIIRQTLIYTNGLDSGHVEVVGEGVDLNEYRPGLDGAAFRNEFGIPLDAPLVGNIGMMRGDKGHHYFLDAALLTLKRHPQARFVLVGEGIGGKRVERELRQRIQEQKEEHRIIMTGYRWDVPKVIAALDIVAVASIEVEAQSRIVPQSFASRKTVVATNVGGIPELLTHEVNGLLVPPKDPHALASAMCKLIEDPGLRAQLAYEGHQFAKERLSMDHMMRKTLDIYRSVL
jgi:glycosyltransferase involved in cell wall biosynthesis